MVAFTGNVLCPALTSQDKPQNSYTEIRGYSELTLNHFINSGYSMISYSQNNSVMFVDKHLIGQYDHVTCFCLLCSV